MQIVLSISPVGKRDADDRGGFFAYLDEQQSALLLYLFSWDAYSKPPLYLRKGKTAAGSNGFKIYKLF